MWDERNSSYYSYCKSLIFNLEISVEDFSSIDFNDNGGSGSDPLGQSYANEDDYGLMDADLPLQDVCS